jgi:hypothetical protein
VSRKGCARAPKIGPWPASGTIQRAATATLPRPFTNNAGSADRPYDITRDGKQFLGVMDLSTEPSSINVVVNWLPICAPRWGAS